ncbi:MAG: hypothetical protein ACC661_09025 [Verrucomicrobiales bacterium]
MKTRRRSTRRPCPLRIPLAALALLAATLGGCTSPRAAPAAPGIQSPPTLQLSAGDARSIGLKIWQNECGGTVAGLTSWNRGEYFASLGIGHFIWYHPSRRGPFEESFPALLSHFRRRGVSTPAWLDNTRGCPWKSYQEFHAAEDSTRMRELRQLLANTVDHQSSFIVQRLEAALPAMLREVQSPGDRSLVRGRFYAVAQSPQGIYALIDYVNFKGEGTAPGERYHGEGWGLLQVLESMEGRPRGAAAAAEFSASAKRVLARRVRNAPPERNESRWLPGWTNRCETYARPL